MRLWQGRLNRITGSGAPRGLTGSGLASHTISEIALINKSMADYRANWEAGTTLEQLAWEAGTTQEQSTAQQAQRTEQPSHDSGSSHRDADHDDDGDDHFEDSGGKVGGNTGGDGGGRGDGGGGGGGAAAGGSTRSAVAATAGFHKDESEFSHAIHAYLERQTAPLLLAMHVKNARKFFCYIAESHTPPPIGTLTLASPSLQSRFIEDGLTQNARHERAESMVVVTRFLISTAPEGIDQLDRRQLFGTYLGQAMEKKRHCKPAKARSVRSPTSQLSNQPYSVV